MQCPGCMEQAVPDLASPRVYQSHGAAGAQFSGNRCFDLSCHSCRIGQSHRDRHILGPLDLWHVLYKAHLRLQKTDNWFWMSGAPNMTPLTTFSNMGRLVAYGLNAPQTSTMFWLWTVIKSVLWLISNGWLVVEIWSFQVLGWCSAPKISLHLVYTWFTCVGKLCVKLL